MRLRVELENGHLDIEDADDLQDVLILLIARADRAEQSGHPEVAAEIELTAKSISQEWESMQSGLHLAGQTMLH